MMILHSAIDFFKVDALDTHQELDAGMSKLLREKEKIYLISSFVSLIYLLLGSKKTTT